ncbi:ATP-binding cassette domain-containing protein [Lachnospiraceae bacterium C1.1]|nr:ATP-binding cassette domain-containing protein [Lachnospiraceae bacterium C1.1]
MESLRPIELIKYGIFIFLETQLGLVLIDILDALVGQDSWIEEIIDMDEKGSMVMVMFIGMAIFTFFTILFKSLFGIIHNTCARRIETNLEFHVSSAAMMRVLSLPPSFFSKYSSGELYERIQYVNELASELVEAFLTLGAGGIFSYAYTLSIFTNAPSLLIPALLNTLIIVAISASTILINLHRTREIMKFQAQESGLIYALISGVRKLRLAGAEKRAFAKWASLYKKEAKHLYRPPLFIKLNATIVLAVNLLGTAVIYYIAVINHVQAKDYFAFSAAYGILSSTISSIAMVATSLATIKPTLEMAEPILNTMPEVTGNRQIVNSISGAVELSNVTFSYDPDASPVIDNINLKIKKGQYVAIVGQTGCGKSTLMRLMLGFEKPKRGSVYYDGKDLQSLDVRSVRRRIGVVMQEGNLFAGNVLTNITITSPQATEEEAWEAAEMAGMADDIRNMPMGMQTMISEGTGGISGGQKQRLLIARAIAQKPKILMFDEATSALDNITQRIVSDSLDKLDCTRIVIAHRLSTIKNCDRIVVLDKGKIAEDGTFDELMKNGGFFKELVKRQMVESAEI